MSQNVQSFGGGVCPSLLSNETAAVEVAAAVYRPSGRQGLSIGPAWRRPPELDRNGPEDPSPCVRIAVSTARQVAGGIAVCQVLIPICRTGVRLPILRFRTSSDRIQRRVSLCSWQALILIFHADVRLSCPRPDLPRG